VFLLKTLFIFILFGIISCCRLYGRYAHPSREAVKRVHSVLLVNQVFPAILVCALTSLSCQSVILVYFN
jgi:hypothetical protein